ncbi:Two-component response regulator ARR18 [Carex littledalei]|uniref:Two-component response regulator ARR18 n=1 Tax=Carex littledalei TaxID=544730 RepID=A0A833V917_9POAL|nr:Two-component response regulator ARR18 [Carex littledalei]
MSWTRDKHQRFVQAVKKVGIDAGPKTILNAMDMAGITVANVSSHLQKFRLQVEEEMKEQNMAAQGASSSNEFTMQGASSSSASPLHSNHTFGGYENANNSPAWTMGNWPPKFSTPYVSVLPCLNQFASDQNNQLKFVRSPVVLGRSSMNNNSNREANIEALLKNPPVPLIELTGDSDYVAQQQNYLITPQVMNSNSISNYSWPNEPSGAMYTPTSGDGLWGLTQSSATINKGKNVQEVAMQNPSNAAVFVNPLNVPNNMSIGSSEQNIIHAGAGESSNENTIMPSIGDPLLRSEDDSAMIDELIFEDEVNGFFNDNPHVIGTAESALFSNENGTGETSDGGMKNKPEEETGSSSNSNIKLDIGLESLFMEHGMMVSPEWNHYLELGMPDYTQKLNSAQNSSAEEMEDDIANYLCD